MGCRAGAGCVGGVDNQLPNILDAFGTTLPMRFPDGMRPVMKAEVRWGRHPLLLVVSGVESFENDPEVELSIYDAVPTFSRDCGSAIPDREYAIVAESVVAADVQRSIYGKFQGSISAGRLRSRGLGFPLYWPADTLGLPPRSVLQNARINMDLRDSGGRRGNVGGYVSGDSVIESLVAGFSGRLVRTQIEGILGGFVDIQCPVPTASTMMSGTCVNRMVTPTRFGNIGMGFGISVVRARLAPMLATGRPPEVCDGTVGDAQVQDVVDASSIADVPRVPDAGPMIDAFVPTDASELDSGG